ncbi:IclR family transcriptional regulator [Brevibacillus sp. SYP-B805]|uniref:IclR family transcriptional regulator domain-containing protein n=1 Tax=Brevibacillus sp. SYP-B805 TaxID=1578199 RepID=UPI0013EC9FDB|nr:IclR family transcriptional regulator [Brevibacillus sp. SYP-B805]
MNGTQTLGRALDILFVLAEAESTLSVNEIAERVSIPESTTYRLLQTLEKNGIVERRAKGQIGLGLRILDLARSLYQQIDRELFVIARPIMETLTENTNETTILMVRTGTNVICIQHVESRRLIRFAIENGRILPLHLGASGKAILAYETKRVVDQILQRLEDQQKKEKLLADLAQIRQQGYCLTVGEVDRDVFGIAAPIFDSYQRIVASLTIAGPAERLSPETSERMVRSVMEATHTISQKLARVSQVTIE